MRCDRSTGRAKLRILRTRDEFPLGLRPLRGNGGRINAKRPGRPHSVTVNPMSLAPNPSLQAAPQTAGGAPPDADLAALGQLRAAHAAIRGELSKVIVGQAE